LEKRKSHLLSNKFDNKLLCNNVINYFLEQNKNNCLRDALNKTIKEFNLNVHYKTLHKHLVDKNVVSPNKASYENEELETLLGQPITDNTLRQNHIELYLSEEQVDSLYYFDISSGTCISSSRDQ